MTVKKEKKKEKREEIAKEEIERKTLLDKKQVNDEINHG